MCGQKKVCVRSYVLCSVLAYGTCTCPTHVLIFVTSFITACRLVAQSSPSDLMRTVSGLIMPPRGTPTEYQVKLYCIRTTNIATVLHTYARRVMLPCILPHTHAHKHHREMRRLPKHSIRFSCLCSFVSKRYKQAKGMSLELWDIRCVSIWQASIVVVDSAECFARSCNVASCRSPIIIAYYKKWRQNYYKYG